MADQDRTRQEARAGDGVELTVTQAHAGVRRGVSRILVISTALAVVALFAAWIFMPRHASGAPAAAPEPATQAARQDRPRQQTRPAAVVYAWVGRLG